MKIDIKNTGIPNICFSLTDKNDIREKKYKQQRLKRGFDDSETWSLRDTIGLFILPRLKRYEELVSDFVERDEKLINQINSFIKSLELITRNEGAADFTIEEEKLVKKGLKVFPEIFMSLWW